MIAHRRGTRPGLGGGTPRRVLALASCAALLALAGCAWPGRPGPAPAPPPVAAPVRPPPPAPPARPAAPGIATPEPGSYDQDKERIKLALARDPRDSLAPAEVGYYMDVLQGRLFQVAGKGVGIARLGDRITLRLAPPAGFEPGSALVAPATREVLAPLTEVLVQYRMTLVSVLVRPDEAAADGAGALLAQQRALALARHLVETGVAGARLVVGGVTAVPAPAKAEGVARVELQLEPIVRDDAAPR